MQRTRRNEIIIGSLLLLVLILTRSGITRSHFGTEFNLPDASWAVFWLMGLLTTFSAWPVMLLVTCAVVDYVVIHGGVSAYCVTPAYAFLIPAYLSLWMMGKWSQSQLPIRTASLLRLMLSLAIGVTTCFVITNISFYLLSGYFSHLSASAFAINVSRYWLYYLLHTAVYAGVGLIIHYCVVHLQRQETGRVKKADR